MEPLAPEEVLRVDLREPRHAGGQTPRAGLRVRLLDIRGGGVHTLLVGEQPDLWSDEGLEILDEDQCLQLMLTVPVGRVAVALGAVPAVFPVNFALYGRTVLFRTGQGTKLDAAVRHAVVAFEVDHFDALYHNGWSVLAVGRAEAITDSRALVGGDGRVRPWADGERDHYVAIDAELVSGRRIIHRNAAPIDLREATEPARFD